MTKRLYCIICFFAIVSCSRNSGETVVVECDADRAVVIDLLSDPAFSKIDLKPAPMKFPDQVVILDDGSFLLNTIDTLFRFDMSDGKLKMTYSRRGRAKNEFVKLWNYWVDRDSVSIFDFNSRKVLVFGMNDSIPARVIEGAGEGAPFEAALRLDDSRWVGKRVGGMPDIPELSLYDNDYKFISKVGDRVLRSGLGMGFPFSRNKEGVLFNMAYSNDIQQVSGEGCYVRYRIRFLDGMLEPDNYKDEYEVDQERMSRQKAGETFSCLPGRIVDSDDFLTFMYSSFRNGKVYSAYAVYDKRKHYCRTYRFLQPDNYTVFPIRHNETVYVFAYHDTGFNVYSIPLKQLLSKYKN